MKMRETAGSMSLFLLIVGVLECMSRYYPAFTAFSLGDLVARLLPAFGFGVGVGYVCAAVLVFRFLPGNARHVEWILLAGMTYTLTLAAQAILDPPFWLPGSSWHADVARDQIVIRGVSLLISFYLLRNLRRLTAAAAQPLVPSLMSQRLHGIDA
jgi:hypothetical protein